jgi:hypothetical protein
MKKIVFAVFVCLFSCNCLTAQTKTGDYSSLLQLCKELRMLERTNLPNGVPDYRQQTIIKTQQTLQQYKSVYQNSILLVGL